MTPVIDCYQQTTTKRESCASFFRRIVLDNSKKVILRHLIHISPSTSTLCKAKPKLESNIADKNRRFSWYVFQSDDYVIHLYAVCMCMHILHSKSMRRALCFVLFRHRPNLPISIRFISLTLGQNTLKAMIPTVTYAVHYHGHRP